MGLVAETPRSSVLVIRPSSGFVPLNLRELWEYRELLYFLTWRDIKVRYKQTVLGIAWAVIQPFLMMLVFTLFFGRLAKIPSDGLPYPIFALTALLPWQLFSRALTDASTSLVSNERLITKVYFPRLLVPTSAVMASLVDFAIAFVLLASLMLFYGIVPNVAVITLPLFILLALITALGVGFWLSALNVQYRDVRYTLPFLTTNLNVIGPKVFSKLSCSDLGSSISQRRKRAPTLPSSAFLRSSKDIVVKAIS